MDKAYKLLHEGTLAFSDIEQNGIKIDTEYCTTQLQSVGRKIKRYKDRLYQFDEVEFWMKKYGSKFSFESDTQLADILFKEFKYKSSKRTNKNKPSVDGEALKTIDSPMIPVFLELKKLIKTEQVLKNIMNEVSEDGFLHPFFNLHTVRTYRSSSQSPNFQNLPIRDKEMGSIIRKAFIPRTKEYMIGGIDYAGIEVCMSTCNSKDLSLIESDMHREQAAECYMVDADEVSKDMRYCGKNQFVFPQLYGSWYEPCAQSLWSSIDTMKLETKEGVKLIDLPWYEKYDLNKFTTHIKKVEENFWKKHKKHKQWQWNWIKGYEEKGYIELLTGFRCGGFIKKNELFNYANQGIAFHCLLWSLIELNKWLKDNNMKSKIIGQIHDEITMDIHIKERNEVLNQAEKIMCEDIRKAWKWIITPLGIEAEFSSVNWFEKERIEL